MLVSVVWWLVFVICGGFGLCMLVFSGWQKGGLCLLIWSLWWWVVLISVEWRWGFLCGVWWCVVVCFVVFVELEFVVAGGPE